MRDLARELARDVRNLSHRLYPPVLEHLGLVAAIGSFCSDLTAREKLPIQFAADTDSISLSSDVSVGLYRIVQEALQNVVKHARASRAEVRLWQTSDALYLRICDDGIGFLPRGRDCATGIGLTSMEERAKLVAGEFHLQSSPGRGTSIEVRVPLRTANSQPH